MGYGEGPEEAFTQTRARNRQKVRRRVPFFRLGPRPIHKAVSSLPAVPLARTPLLPDSKSSNNFVGQIQHRGVGKTLDFHDE